MSLLFAQVRRCEKALHEAREWRRKNEKDRTYGELWQSFKMYLSDVRDAKQYQKLISSVPGAPQPKKTVASAGELGGKPKKTKALRGVVLKWVAAIAPPGEPLPSCEPAPSPAHRSAGFA